MHDEKLISKPDPASQAKVKYKIAGKTQICFGKILKETDSYLYVELTDKQYRMIMRHCIISITFPEDVPESESRVESR